MSGEVSRGRAGIRSPYFFRIHMTGGHNQLGEAQVMPLQNAPPQGPENFRSDPVTGDRGREATKCLRGQGRRTVISGETQARPARS